MFNIDNRKKFYKKNFNSNCHSSGMLVEFEVKKDLFSAAQAIIRKIVEKSYFFTHHKKLSFEEILKIKKLNLLNKTPNGLLTIQREISLEYQMLHEIYSDILINLKLNKYINKIHFPLALRITNKFIKTISQRKKSISTPHSDLWVGHDIDATIWLPFFGDLNTSGINFFEPIETSENFSKTYDSFQEAAKNSFKKTIQIKPKLKLGNLYMFDAYCLHGTMQKKNTNYRISFDSYFNFKQKISGRKKSSNSNLDKFYIDVTKFTDIGYSNKLISSMNFAKTKKLFLKKNNKILNPHEFGRLVK